jgi:hypothetical protein
LVVRETCIVDNCPKHRAARGLCHTHYGAWRQGRLPKIETLPLKRDMPKGSCRADSCDRPAAGRGLCHAHYQQERMGVPLRPVRISREKRGCVVPNCKDRHEAHGYCVFHYRRAVGSGEVPSGHRLPSLVGEGYVRLFVPSHPNAQKTGHILEHTYVMSAILGRPLWPDENVHHKNGVKHDNRPENLELWAGVGRQPKGQRVDDLVAWAKEILGRYEPDALT